ncbi:secreted protein [Rhodopirellula maiorica SM1]|uniref:Secreted protein n=1 Tax=Rhodopirellula maiorica SM1 TaxID=1265738 RepID=M5RUC8_9BACT|nr:secreted protein [Rhodopirellula maiorica SM1]
MKKSAFLLPVSVLLISMLVLGCNQETPNMTTAPPPPPTPEQLKAQAEHYSAPSAQDRQQ